MSDPSEKSAAGAIISITLIFGLGYAILRYHIVGPVPWKDFPLFILNKGLSLSGFVLLACNFAFGPMKNMGIAIPPSWRNARKALGMTGFLFVLIHVLMSFLLFGSASYPKLFESDGTPTLLAGWSMLGGVLGFVVLWAYNLSFQTHLREDEAFIRFITSRRFLLIALTLGGVHVAFMGLPGWLKPAGWHGGLPPISLVAFAVFVVGHFANLLGPE